MRNDFHDSIFEDQCNHNLDRQSIIVQNTAKFSAKTKHEGRRLYRRVKQNPSTKIYFVYSPSLRSRSRTTAMFITSTIMLLVLMNVVHPFPTYSTHPIPIECPFLNALHHCALPEEELHVVQIGAHRRRRFFRENLVCSSIAQHFVKRPIPWPQSSHKSMHCCLSCFPKYTHT